MSIAEWTETLNLMARVYISNIAPGWPVSRQEALLDQKVPGWRDEAVFRDETTERQRRAKLVEALYARSDTLRITSRKAPIPIYVAAFPVIAWNADDFRNVLDRLPGGNCILKSVDTGSTIGPRPSKDERNQAVEEFKTRRRKASEEVSRLHGAAVSAARRHQRVVDGCEKIKDRWGMPSKDWNTKILLKEAGEPGKPLAYNSVTMELGGREKAQRLYQAAQKRQAKKEQQR